MCGAEDSYRGAAAHGEVLRGMRRLLVYMNIVVVLTAAFAAAAAKSDSAGKFLAFVCTMLLFLAIVWRKRR